MSCTYELNSRRIEIVVWKENSHLRLEIKDNGKGIAQEEIGKIDSFGIVGMKERVHPFGGDLEVTGQEGIGTVVAARIPLARKRRK